MSSKEIGIEDARKKLGDLVTAAQQGTDIILTRNRKPAARLTRHLQEDAMTAAINVGDTVTVSEEQVPDGWSRTGEVVSWDGQSYVVELEDGHRCEVLPDALQIAADVEVVNCTPHAITVAGVTIEPSGIIPRVAEEVTPLGIVTDRGAEIPLTQVRLGQVTGLPAAKPGAVYVVSRMTAEAAPDRTDLLIPGKQVRDDQGRIVGAESLCRLPRRGKDNSTGTIPAALLLNHIPADQASWTVWRDRSRPAPANESEIKDEKLYDLYGSQGFDFPDDGLTRMLEAVGAGESVYIVLPGSARHEYDADVEEEEHRAEWSMLAYSAHDRVLKVGDCNPHCASTWLAVPLTATLPLTVYRQAVEIISGIYSGPVPAVPE